MGQRGRDSRGSRGSRVVGVGVVGVVGVGAERGEHLGELLSWHHDIIASQHRDITGSWRHA